MKSVNIKQAYFSFVLPILYNFAYENNTVTNCQMNITNFIFCFMLLTGDGVCHINDITDIDIELSPADNINSQGIKRLPARLPIRVCHSDREIRIISYCQTAEIAHIVLRNSIGNRVLVSTICIAPDNFTSLFVGDLEDGDYDIIITMREYILEGNFSLAR